jgi:hypothetical protein
VGSTYYLPCQSPFWSLSLFPSYTTKGAKPADLLLLFHPLMLIVDIPASITLFFIF